MQLRQTQLNEALHFVSRFNFIVGLEIGDIQTEQLVCLGSHHLLDRNLIWLVPTLSELSLSLSLFGFVVRSDFRWRFGLYKTMNLEHFWQAVLDKACYHPVLSLVMHGFVLFGATHSLS